MDAKIERKKRLTFKTYDQAQVLQVPINVGDLIPLGHLVRIIDEIVEGIDLSSLEPYYVGGGRSPYHPKMMIKVWIYGYCERLYTSRRLAKGLRENINLIWLSGNQQPCFKTLSEFRGERMQEMVDVVFKQVLLVLIDSEYIDLEDLYVDGSKWEANANKYKRVWRANTERYKSAVLNRISLLLEEIKALQREEDAAHGSGDLSEVGEGKEVTVVLTGADVAGHLVTLRSLVEEEAAKGAEAKAKVKAMSSLGSKLEAEHAKLVKYEGQEAILGPRNSYSQTDEDATMMRMKDERLLPGYNVQHSTSNQYVVNYTLAQNSSDSPTLPAHLDKMEERFEGMEVPPVVNLSADAGYGSEENYANMEGRGIIGFVKYPLWWQEQEGKLAKRTFRAENWTYDVITDTYTCPNERTLTLTEEKTVTSANGYEKVIHVYTCESCADCPFAADCKKSEEKERTVSHSPKGEAYKAEARERLDSEKGKEMRSKRSIEVESVFGDIKYNMQHRRFVLRGLEKVNVEYGFLSIAHNIRKVFCQKSGCWAEYYAQRAAKKVQKAQKRA